MWKKILSEIEKTEAKYGDSLEKPATLKETNKLKEQVQEKFNVELPEQYLKFLRTVNGLAFNGLVIYGVDEELLDSKGSGSITGFIETNEIWYENDWQKQFIFFGDSDISWYCYDIKNSKYEIQDKPSGSVMEEYKDFDSLLEAALKTRL